MMKNNKRLVFGAGVIDTDIELKENGRYINVYRTWRSMIRQSYGENIKGRRVDGLSVCKEWHFFSLFKDWYEKNHKEGFYMSRNILDPDNTLYSPETCVFIPYSWGKLFGRGELNRNAILEEFARCSAIYKNDNDLMDIIDKIIIRIDN
ncbi:hypothetical protein ETN89_20125 (plasmid) [Photobacterium damselae subsp. damselae]|uniref:hypothetical protein n=2 Tax=Photobacterium damselae TaxID=38293 RepID=UPI001012682C|nr:hypothetical protein [Photobacterium damselae]QAY37563.1 hypothetical protein ETN89_20125 [Photobacterium damselae subsp. damselae]